MSVLDEVSIEISVVLGHASMPIGQLLRMGRGALIKLDADRDAPVKVYANDRLIAHGELMIKGEDISIAVTDVKTD